MGEGAVKYGFGVRPLRPAAIFVLSESSLRSPYLIASFEKVVIFVGFDVLENTFE